MPIVISAALYAGATVSIAISCLALLGVDPGEGALRACMMSAGIGGIIGAAIGLHESRSTR